MVKRRTQIYDLLNNKINVNALYKLAIKAAEKNFDRLEIGIDKFRLKIEPKRTVVKSEINSYFDDIYHKDMVEITGKFIITKWYQEKLYTVSINLRMSSGGDGPMFVHMLHSLMYDYARDTISNSVELSKHIGITGLPDNLDDFDSNDEVISRLVNTYMSSSISDRLENYDNQGVENLGTVHDITRFSGVDPTNRGIGFLPSHPFVLMAPPQKKKPWWRKNEKSGRNS